MAQDDNNNNNNNDDDNDDDDNDDDNEDDEDDGDLGTQLRRAAYLFLYSMFVVFAMQVACLTAAMMIMITTTTTVRDRDNDASYYLCANIMMFRSRRIIEFRRGGGRGAASRRV
jgi:hypothetical protein